MIKFLSKVFDSNKKSIKKALHIPDLLMDDKVIPTVTREVTKLEQAKERLGERYLLHPSNNVQRKEPFLFDQDKFFDLVRKGY